MNDLFCRKYSAWVLYTPWTKMKDNWHSIIVMVVSLQFPLWIQTQTVASKLWGRPVRFIVMMTPCSFHSAFNFCSYCSKFHSNNGTTLHLFTFYGIFFFEGLWGGGWFYWSNNACSFAHYGFTVLFSTALELWTGMASVRWRVLLPLGCPVVAL